MSATNTLAPCPHCQSTCNPFQMLLDTKVADRRPQQKESE